MTLQVDGPNVAPLPVQVLQDQAAVAVLRSGLAAQQYRWDVEEILAQRLLDPALPQEVEERPLVVGPFSTVSVGVQDLTRRGEQGFVDVIDAAQLSRKNGRSALRANPASLDALFSRTSMSRPMPASFSAPKNSGAVFFVKPIVWTSVLSPPSRGTGPAGRRPSRPLSGCCRRP